jgi:hypothetical protein
MENWNGDGNACSKFSSYYGGLYKVLGELDGVMKAVENLSVVLYMLVLEPARAMLVHFHCCGAVQKCNGMYGTALIVVHSASLRVGRRALGLQLLGA